jgi:hypothetical protein
MKTGATVAIVVGSVVLVGGGVAAVLLLRKRGQASSYRSDAQELAAAQVALGSKAVATGVMPAAAPALPSAGGGGGGSAASPGANAVFGLAGNVLDKYYPGMGSKAAGLAKAIDSKVGLGLISKVPGLKKLKFW